MNKNFMLLSQVFMTCIMAATMSGLTLGDVAKKSAAKADAA